MGLMLEVSTGLTLEFELDFDFVLRLEDFLLLVLEFLLSETGSSAFLSSRVKAFEPRAEDWIESVLSSNYSSIASSATDLEAKH